MFCAGPGGKPHPLRPQSWPSPESWKRLPTDVEKCSCAQMPSRLFRGPGPCPPTVSLIHTGRLGRAGVLGEASPLGAAPRAPQLLSSSGTRGTGPWGLGTPPEEVRALAGRWEGGFAGRLTGDPKTTEGPRGTRSPFGNAPPFLPPGPASPPVSPSNPRPLLLPTLAVHWVPSCPPAHIHA